MYILRTMIIAPNSPRYPKLVSAVNFQRTIFLRTSIHTRDGVEYAECFAWSREHLRRWMLRSTRDRDARESLCAVSRRRTRRFADSFR